MSKVARCKDAGLNCEIVIRGDSEEDLRRSATEHANSVHPTEFTQSPLSGIGAAALQGAGGGTIVGASANHLQNYLREIINVSRDE